ncbi:hypothetical protein [Roseovarius atlanticus]|uniref:hypothetical protein n=1 Tax=Roseovarius atlanticus TaxID=1641875 RepID=UPI001C98B3DA|nr:hypothetical protein [Roseovarius atlanticus]MBY5988199.1 hypothetical protein [Roseovarius atlanticus]MBY6123590.1 hypothetical protein [Roseovarius atlanticus]MBY6148085.1 hypothetical protein [Roseovarius atlanticus]
MEQLELFDIDRSRQGATWWAGSWECRNWHGWYQEREAGTGAWCFRIDGFKGEPETWGEASVYALDRRGELCTFDVPIDPLNRLHIRGMKFGRGHWNH